MNFFSNLWGHILAFFTGAQKLALEAVHNINLSDLMANAAQSAVLAVEASGGTGATKFQNAVAILESSFATAALGSIQTAVQLAWAKEFGASATPKA